MKSYLRFTSPLYARVIPDRGEVRGGQQRRTRRTGNRFAVYQHRPIQHCSH